MRIAVTGASGFIGGHICGALRAAGHDVQPFGRRPAAELASPLERYQQWDVAMGPRDLSNVDALVHCAAAVGQWGSEAYYQQVNVRGAEHVLASLSQRVRVVHISTASVYADHGAQTLSERSALVGRGHAAYATTKAAVDRMMLALARPAVVLRPHIVYGPGDTTLWPRVLRAVRGDVLRVPGDGKARISTTHVSHLADAVLLAVQSTAPTGAFNIADAEASTVDVLLRTMFRRHAVDVQLSYLPRAVAWTAALGYEALWTVLGRTEEPPLTRYAVASLADGCRLDIARARSELGFTPRWTIADAPL